ncbi:MAG: CHAT domain-containing protein [Saprospiraceae bacterium]
MDVIDRMWFALLEEDKLRSFFQDKAGLYEKASLCCIRLGYYKKAFELLEKAKTRYLGDLIARRQMAPNRVLSKEIREYWEQTGKAKAVAASLGGTEGTEANIISSLSKGKIPKGSPIYLPVRQWALNKAVEDDETGQTQALKTIVDKVWDVVGFLGENTTNLSSENILKVKEHLDAIYQVIAKALEKTRNEPDFQKYSRAANSLREWDSEFKNSSLWVFQEYIEIIEKAINALAMNNNNTSFELFLIAILEALDFNLEHNPVKVVSTGQYSPKDSEGWTYTFHTEDKGSEKTASLEEILLPLWQKRSSSSWRYIDQLARGESITFRETQALLDGQVETAMIAYQVTSQGTVIYIFLAQNASASTNNLFPNLEGRDLFFVYTLPSVTESHLEELFFGKNGWVKLQKNERQNWKKNMHEALGLLYNELIVPINGFLKKNGIKHLRIIPHRHLHLVPFAALWYKKKEEKHYLIDDYDIAYLPSATLVNIALKRAATKNQSQTLTAVTNPTGDLHFAEVEVDYLLRRYHGWNKKDLRGKNATRKKLEALELGHLFHFSGHASYNWEDPLSSHLNLSDDKLELGCLFDEALLAKQLHMAVLSACETGITDPASLSDEYLGLGSGFLFAGASTILSTLWPVSDQATALLMRQFYYSFKFLGYSPPEALQRAQQWLKGSTIKEQDALLHNLDYRSSKNENDYQRGIGNRAFGESLNPSHPYFWAGFKILGI